jgi:hypothetical protein
MRRPGFCRTGRRRRPPVGARPPYPPAGRRVRPSPPCRPARHRPPARKAAALRSTARRTSRPSSSAKVRPSTMRPTVPRAIAGCSCAAAPRHPNMTVMLAATAAARPPSRQPFIGVKGKAAMRQHYGNDATRAGSSTSNWDTGGYGRGRGAAALSRPSCDVRRFAPCPTRPVARSSFPRSAAASPFAPPRPCGLSSPQARVRRSAPPPVPSGAERP